MASALIHRSNPVDLYPEVRSLFRTQLKTVENLALTIEEIYRDESLSNAEKDQLVKPYKQQAFQIAEQLADAYDQLMPTGESWLSYAKKTFADAASGLWEFLVILTTMFSGGYSFYKIMANAFYDMEEEKQLPNPMSSESALGYMLANLLFAGISVGFISFAIGSFTSEVERLLASIFATSEEEALRIAHLEKRLRDGYLFFIEEINQIASGSRRCSLCLEPYRNGHAKVFLTTCGHSFGDSCIRQYLRDCMYRNAYGYAYDCGCPICKRRFTQDDIGQSIRGKGKLRDELVKLKHHGFMRR